MSGLHRLVLGSIFALSLAFVGKTEAADMKVVSIQNRTGLAASDLHVTFTGTGGAVFVAPATVVAPPCPEPLVPSNGQVTNTVTIDWGMPCVQPGAFVTFWVYSPNGPLNVDTIRWTLNGADIGFGRNPIVRNIPGGGGGAFWGLAIQSKCIGGPWAIYSAWMFNGSCWERDVCFPRIVYFTRVALCRFVNRRGRLVNTGICFPLTNWAKSWVRTAFYTTEFASIRPPNLGPEIIPINGGIHNGPPIRRVGMNRRGVWNFGSVKSNDLGQNWSATADFRGTFTNIAGDLEPYTPTQPNLSTPEQMLQYRSAGFATAAGRFEALRQAVVEVDSFEPDPEYAAIAADLTTLRDSFNSISVQFGSGFMPSDSLVWENCRLAVLDLSSRMSLLMPTRASHVQPELQSMANGFMEARDMVAAGFTDMSQVDNFLYAVLLRIIPAFESAGIAMGPHVRINLTLGAFGWYPQLVTTGALCYVTNAANGAELDTAVVRVSEGGAIDLPIDAYDASVAQLRIGIKFDTFLSQAVTLPNADMATATIGTMRNGDADGDDAISQGDVAKINAEFGAGGGPAPYVPSSDVNSDGSVNIDDLNHANNNLGQVGSGFRLVTGRIALGDFVGNTENELLEVDVRDTNGNVLESHEVLPGNGFYSFVTNRTAGQTVQIGAKGRHWLRRGRTVTLGAADEPFPYANGSLSTNSGGIWSLWSNTSADALMNGGIATINATTDMIREFGAQLLEDGQVLHWSFDLSVTTPNTGNDYIVMFSPASYPYDTNQNYGDSFGILVDFGVGPGGTSNVYAWPNTGGTVYLVGTMTPGPFHTISGTMVKSGGQVFYSARVDNGTIRNGTFTHTDPRGINAVEFYQGGASGTNGNGRIDNIRFSSGSSSVTTVDFSLINGDVDGDNEVAIGDYSQFSASYNAFPGDMNYIEEADLNGDEAVDIADFAILSAHYGEFGD